MLQAWGGLAQADAARSPPGCRFVAPAGALKTTLTLAGCVDKPLDTSLPLTLEQDHLALLEFDGMALSVASTLSFAPTTLETLHGEVAQVASHGGGTDGTLAKLTWRAAASLLPNVVVLAALLLRKRA